MELPRLEEKSASLPRRRRSWQGRFFSNKGGKPSATRHLRPSIANQQQSSPTPQLRHRNATEGLDWGDYAQLFMPKVEPEYKEDDQRSYTETASLHKSFGQTTEDRSFYDAGEEFDEEMPIELQRRHSTEDFRLWALWLPADVGAPPDDEANTSDEADTSDEANTKSEARMREILIREIKSWGPLVPRDFEVNMRFEEVETAENRSVGDLILRWQNLEQDCDQGKEMGPLTPFTVYCSPGLRRFNSLICWTSLNLHCYHPKWPPGYRPRYQGRQRIL